LEIEIIHDIVLDTEVSFEDLLACVEVLNLEGEAVDWIREMAGDGMAEPA
jgi:hypothetical protein